jgi:hypothetical protein
MDPLSITTSCLALLTAVGKTTVAVTNFIRGCREARADLTAVAAELSQLAVVLELIKDDTAVTGHDHILPESLQLQIRSIVGNCAAVIDKIDAALQSYGTRMAAARWTIYGKSEVAGLRMSLEAHRGSLNLVLELVSVSLSRTIKDNTFALRSEVQAIKQDTVHIPQIWDELTRLRAIVAALESPAATRGQHFILQQYLDGLSSYAESVCNDVVWDSDGSVHTLSRASSRLNVAGSPTSLSETRQEAAPDAGANPLRTAEVANVSEASIRSRSPPPAVAPVDATQPDPQAEPIVSNQMSLHNLPDTEVEMGSHEQPQMPGPALRPTGNPDSPPPSSATGHETSSMEQSGQSTSVTSAESRHRPADFGEDLSATSGSDHSVPATDRTSNDMQATQSRRNLHFRSLNEARAARLKAEFALSVPAIEKVFDGKEVTQREQPLSIRERSLGHARRKSIQARRAKREADSVDERGPLPEHMDPFYTAEATKEVVVEDPSTEVSGATSWDEYDPFLFTSKPPVPASSFRSTTVSPPRTETVILRNNVAWTNKLLSQVEEHSLAPSTESLPEPSQAGGKVNPASKSLLTRRIHTLPTPTRIHRVEPTDSPYPGYAFGPIFYNHPLPKPGNPDPEVAAELTARAEARRKLVIVGDTGIGKTLLLM